MLGSGLGEFAEKLDVKKSISTSDIPGYPASTVKGHKGKLHFAQSGDNNVLIFQGRIHLYEGYKMIDALLPIELTASLGTENLILTNAAGGISADLEPGELMINSSFNSFAIKKELTDLLGVASVEEKNEFIDFPSSRIIEVFTRAYSEQNVNLRLGLYWFTKGPSYETPAEIQMIKLSGGDAVGMSTVHEAIYGALRGMQVGAISLITNFAAGISEQKLSHQEVIETAEMSKQKFEALMKRIIELV